MTFAHYGHNYGQDPVCHYSGPDGIVLPHGEGLTAAMRWCPECRQVLKEVGGMPLLDVQLDLFEPSA